MYNNLLKKRQKILEQWKRERARVGERDGLNVEGLKKLNKKGKKITKKQWKIPG